MEQNKKENLRYPALKTISTIYRILAWIIGILTVISTICFPLLHMGGLSEMICYFLIGAFVVLVLIAFSEIIRVFIDIEYNTRKNAGSNDVS